MIDPLGYDDLCACVYATKRADLSDWKTGTRPNSARLVAPLSGGPARVSGLMLVATCVPSLPDRSLSLTMTAEINGKPRPIARVDWRDGPHDNTDPLCGPYRWLAAGETHLHAPADHRHIPDMMQALAENLPVAVPLDPAPQSLSELLAACAILLCIENLQDMQTPPWQSQIAFL